MKRITAAVFVAVTAVVAGCGSSSGTISTKPATPVAVQYNPVAILKLAGAIPDPGETYGRVGMDDNQIADGQFTPGQRSDLVMGNAEYLTVFTYRTTAERDYHVAHPVLAPQDDEALVTGPHASLIIVTGASGVAWGSPAEHGPSPQQIAARVRGTVVYQR